MRHHFREQIIIDLFRLRQFDLGKHDLVRHHLRKKIIVDLLGLGQFHFGKDHLFRHPIGEFLVIERPRHALRDILLALFVHHDVVVDLVRNFGFDDLRDAVVIDGIGNRFRRFCRLIYSVVIDRLRRLRHSFGNTLRHDDVIDRLRLGHILRDLLRHSGVIDRLRLRKVIRNLPSDDGTIHFFRLRHIFRNALRDLGVIHRLGLGHILCDLLCNRSVIHFFGLRHTFRDLLRHDDVIQSFRLGHFFRDRFGYFFVIDRLGHPRDHGVRELVVIHGLGLDGRGHSRDDGFREQIVIDRFGLSGRGKLGDDHIGKLIVIDLLGAGFGQDDLGSHRLRERVGIHFRDRLRHSRRDVCRQRLLVERGRFDALRRFEEILVDAAIVHLFGIRQGFHYLLGGAVDDSVVIDCGGNFARGFALRFLRKGIAQLFEHLFADFLHDAGIIHVFRNGNRRYRVEDLLIVGDEARFRFFRDGFRNFIVIDLFLHGKRLDDFFLHRFGNRIVIGFRTGNELVELILDLRERSVDLFQEFDLAFHRFELGKNVVGQNGGERFVNHLVLLIAVFQLANHRLHGLRIRFRGGVGFFLNGLIQRAGLQRVVFEFVHQLFFHLLQIVRDAVIQSLDHKGRFIPPRRYVRISVRRSLFLIVVAVIRHITPQFILFACEKKSDKLTSLSFYTISDEK